MCTKWFRIFLCRRTKKKKRVSKKRAINEEIQTPQIELKTEMEVGNYWEDTYKELFGAILPIDSLTSYNLSSAGSDALTPFVSTYEPEPLIISAMSSTPPQQMSPINYNPLSITTMALELPQSNNNTQIVGGLNDLSFLLEQIKELHESNRDLANKLNTVTNELIGIKKDSLNDKKLTVLGGWHTFGSQQQQDLAISVWKATHVEDGQCSRNFLVEGNNKFVELLGYPMDVLKNNFACTNMIRKQDLSPDSKDKNCEREWPKRTRIITAYGEAEVFITITPVQDCKNGPPKYFVVYMLEVNQL